MIIRLIVIDGQKFKKPSRMDVNSPSALIWKRFKKKKLALAGLLIVIFSIALSLVANFIVYDHTPNADLQFSTLSLRPPGFNTKMLLVNKKNTSSPTSLWDQFVYGKDKTYDPIPYLSLDSDSPTDIVISTHYGSNQIIPKSQVQGYDELTFWLGTDRYGRSISSRIIRGIRVSLFVGFIAVVISLSLGVLLGLLAGYYRGWIDGVIQYLINVTWSIPTLLLVFAIVLAFGRGVGVIFVAVGLTMWVDVARIVRGQVIAERESQYVTAARSIGQVDKVIMFRHILPNIVGPILVIAAANFATAILVEAGLSYLGFGIAPPAPSIGNMLNDHYGYAVSGKLFLAIVPAAVIVILVLSFNMIGAGLRDAFDVESNQ